MRVLVRAALLRFAIVYWVLFALVMLDDEIAGTRSIGRVWNTVWAPLVRWVGTHVLGITADLDSSVNGSGDKSFDYVSLVCAAGIGVIAGVAWTLLDPKRANDAKLRALLRGFLRYLLAFTILDYGIAKLFGGQFWPPSEGRLMQRYGDSSPMGLMWTFMGASPAYVMFSGFAETLGAVLLLFRRTTTVGALILVAVLCNVVMLNFCYDVCVKIASTHYLAISVYVLLPDLRRLADVLIFQRPTMPVPAPPPARPWRMIVKYTLVTAAVALAVWHGWQGRPRAQCATWYSGYWNVVRFVRDGREVPPLVTDATRWRRVKFETYDDTVFVRWRFMDDSYGDLYDVSIDEQAHTMTLTPNARFTPAHSTGPIVFAYTRKDASHISLSGNAITVDLEHFEPEQMLLLTRGFHWINEQPFNR